MPKAGSATPNSSFEILSIDQTHMAESVVQVAEGFVVRNLEDGFDNHGKQ